MAPPMARHAAARVADRAAGVGRARLERPRLAQRHGCAGIRSALPGPETAVLGG
jgi:hypothetical protein